MSSHTSRVGGAHQLADACGIFFLVFSAAVCSRKQRSLLLPDSSGGSNNCSTVREENVREYGEKSSD